MIFSWRDVLDTNKKQYGLINYAAEATKKVGYKYFCWNDWIYDLDYNQIMTLSAAGLVKN